jgi:O-antigen biosynthesis protein WbqP
MYNKILAFFLLIIISPLFVFISIVILIEDGFPIFFKQKRFGIDNSFFILYKFRTMKKNTPNVATHLLQNPQEYLFKSSNFLRRTSLDELPNLINIIKGEMLFVGPRPALFNQVDLIAYRIATGVSKLKPGITGWAQINGRDEISEAKKAELDQEYLHKKSFLLDIEILLKTFINVIRRKGVSH